jgi:hypothetical protein
VTNERKQNLRQIFANLDPVDLLNQIRQAQRRLADLEVRGGCKAGSEADQELSRFVKSLSTAWRGGEVRPTYRKHPGPRTWRTRLDPFEKVWPLVVQWLNEQPGTTAKDLFHRLQAELSEPFQPGQLRTLQRRVKQWRCEIARQLVLDAGLETAESADILARHKSKRSQNHSCCREAVVGVIVAPNEIREDLGQAM